MAKRRKAPWWEGVFDALGISAAGSWLSGILGILGGGGA